MSSDESPNVPAPRDRREAVREKAQQVHAKQSRLRVLRGVLLGAGGIVLLGAAAGAVVWALTTMGPQPQLQPSNAQQDGFTVTTVPAPTEAGDSRVGDSTASPTPTDAPAAAAVETPEATDAPSVDIRIYVDYLSTGARDFQVANMQQLQSWVTQDAATLSYYPVAMLTSKSNGTKYSLRAASAAACVATHSPDTFFTFNDVLLRGQPEIDSDGLSDTELADLAQGSGVTSAKTVRTCIEDEAFAAWARAATDRALEGLPDTEDVALTGTPMVLVNGVPYVGALDDPKEFAQFVFASASDAYFRTPSPTPTDSASPTATPADEG